MISTQRIIYCINPGCTNPKNPLGERLCANCQTPLVRRYVWVSGEHQAKIRPGETVADKYEIITSQIWLDIKPSKLPDLPSELPKAIIPYLRLYQERLHLPQVYGFAGDMLLLENVPIDDNGNLYSAIADAWEQATPVRQVYYLWQIIQLWQPLSDLGVALSLLFPDNLRVQGWCVRLLELYESPQPSLQQLGECWKSWIAVAQPSIAQPLQTIVDSMCAGEIELKAIATQLNQLLLSQAAQLPLNLKVAGSTDIGLELTQNEDTCYPLARDLDDPLLPRLSIVCDGIGGHQGGEVASLLAVQSLKLQIRALLAEVAEQTELVSSYLLQQQIEASLRVVNNVICACNDEQKRQGRERMATTIVMSVQVPQKVHTTPGWQSENSHELYLANIGDSRAYWITQNYCQLLTVDDDVVTREVRFARTMYRQALQRDDAHALTQALGTKDGEFLHPVIQRFILEEDGILLLCSDGLSDNNLVETYWQDYAVPVLKGKLSLEDAIQNWIAIANEKNGHDNTSVVLTHCRISPEYLVPITQSPPPIEIVEEPQPEQPLTESSQPLPDLELTEEASASSSVTTPLEQPIKPSRGKRTVLLGGLFALLAGGTIGLFAWSQLNPQGFGQTCRQLPSSVRQLCPRF